MGVTAPADRRFRRAHVKPARRRAGWLAGHWRAAAGLAVCGVALYAGHRAAGLVAALEMFQVQRIVIHGNQRLSNGEVLALLQGLRGRSLLAIDLEDWRLAVMNSPWVADAGLRRTLPSTVDVTIRERSPLGVGRINGSLYLVDERGIVIDEYGPSYADLDLPIIDGLSSTPGEEATDIERAMLARRLLESLRTRNLAAQISQIDVSDARNAVVLLEGNPTLLRLGNERFVERLQSYLEIASALGEQVPSIDYVDLRFDQRVYVKPAPGAKPVPGAKPSTAKPRTSTQTG